MISLRSWYWRLRLRAAGASVGKGLAVMGPLSICLRDGASLKNLRIGNNVMLGGRTYIRMRKHGAITLEDDVRTGTETWLVVANDATLRIGARSDVGSYCILNGGYGIDIGQDCLFAAFLNVNSSSHRMERGALIREQGYVGGEVTIGNDVWIGGHVSLNMGVTVGEGSVIGAGAVVTRSIPPHKIALGGPAKVVHERD